MKTKFLKILCCFMLLVFSGCSAFSLERSPYTINADFVMDEESSVYKICGVELSFSNLATETVKEFEVVFFLFDSDGEPAYECPNRLAFSIEREIGPDEDFSVCLSLDSYMTFVPQSLLEIDYLYVSRITYADGSIWVDPYGFSAFM